MVGQVLHQDSWTLQLIIVLVFAGPAVSLHFKNVPAYFSVSDVRPAEHFENQRVRPHPNAFDLELLDGNGYRAACSKQDR